MFSCVLEENLYRKFVALIHFPKAHTYILYFFLYTKVWKYMKQIINNSHLWIIKMSIFSSTFAQFTFIT